MNNKDRILDSVRYIESNLKSDISVHDIAKEACCSLYHFIRLFQSITGISPKKYLLHRRLTDSILSLQHTDDKILNIAYNYQFGSHETYTRSFQKLFGTSPSKIRQGGTIPAQLMVKRITEDYIFQSGKARDHVPEQLELKEKILVGVSYFIRGDLKELDLTEQWNTFMKMSPLIKNKSNPDDCFQVQYWSDNQTEEGMHFFIGTEVDILKDIDPQFVIKIIPQGTYLKFIHQGLSKNVGFTYRYIYNEYLPETDYNLNLPFNFEHYGKDFSSPIKEKSESHLYIPVTLS